MYLQCALQLSLYVVQFWQVYIDVDLDVIGFVLVLPFSRSISNQQSLVPLKRVQTSSHGVNITRLPLMEPTICRLNSQATQHRTACHIQVDATSTYICGMARLLLCGLAALCRCVLCGIVWTYLNTEPRAPISDGKIIDNYRCAVYQVSINVTDIIQRYQKFYFLERLKILHFKEILWNFIKKYKNILRKNGK